jgi:hypothetical protein
MIDYDELCEAVGVRVQDGDHLVRQVVSSLQQCKSAQHAIKKATQHRASCVREEKFLMALIYDTAIRRFELEIENE